MVLYQNAACGVRAKKLFDRLSDQTGGGHEFDLELWRFDMLELSAAAEEVLSAAREAALLVVSCQAGTDLPGWMLEWLEVWRLFRAEEHSALVLLTDAQAHNEMTASQPCQSLRQFADANGLALFCECCPPWCQATGPLEDGLRERESLMTPTLQGIMNRAEPMDRRHWALNG